MERLPVGDRFTGKEPVQLSADPIPTGNEPLYSKEGVRIFDEGRGIQYTLRWGSSDKLVQWEDYFKGVQHLAVRYNVKTSLGVTEAWRDPSIEEMVRFVRIAMRDIPDNTRVSILCEQVKIRIEQQAKAADTRSKELRSLSEHLFT